jgi:hypothetical protein
VLPDGVADGIGGGLRTSVGVGTGGIVSVGVNGEDAVLVGVGATEDIGAALGGTGTGGVETAAPGRGGREEYWIGVPGWDVAVGSGAVPMPPAPPGALAMGGFSAGGPSSHPTVTANGNPTTTMPRKTYLGESRTQ